MTSVFHAWGLLYRMNRIHDCLLPNDATGDCRARAIQLDMWRLSGSGVLDLPVLAASSAKVSVLEALSQFKTGVDKGTFPRPIVLARLISALGRLGETQKIAEVYDASQAGLSSMELMKLWQTSDWFLNANQACHFAAGKKVLARRHVVGAGSKSRRLLRQMAFKHAQRGFAPDVSRHGSFSCLPRR